MRTSYLKPIAALLGTMVLALLVGCAATPAATPTSAATPTAPAGGEGDLAGTSWVLVSLGPAGDPAPVVEGSEITLNLEPGGQATGSGGCNSYGGSYQVQDGTVSFGEIVHTERACLEQEKMDQEGRFFEALQTAGQYERAGDELTIWYQDGESVMRWARA